MNLEKRLGDVETNGRNRLSVLLAYPGPRQGPCFASAALHWDALYRPEVSALGERN
jgi:hypothetical protein